MEKLYIKGLIEKKANGGYSVLASTSTVDRQGDTINQNGWDLANFKLNPVMLWAHEYDTLPVAKVIGFPADARGLAVDYEFAPASANPMAAQIKELVDGGFLNAVSVGFMPLERNGNAITKMELLEISFVPVPANPQALQLMLGKSISHEVISKFFEVKEAEIVAAEKSAACKGVGVCEDGECDHKGAVADEVNAEEQLELKYQNLDKVWEVMGAFCQVYFNENTPVESFNELLTEAIGLLTALVGDEGTQDEAQTASLKSAMLAAVGVEAAKSFKLKMGAKHSAVTTAALQKAMEHTDAASGVLKELIAPKDADEPDEDEPAEDSEKGVDVLRSLCITRDLLREDNTETFSALTAVNALIKSRS